MTVKYECTDRPAHVFPRSKPLGYDPDEGALCPVCGAVLDVLVEAVWTVRGRRADADTETDPA